jgi:hypothetical protein
VGLPSYIITAITWPMVATVNFGPPSQDFKKGVARFLEKRACFTGR